MAIINEVECIVDRYLNLYAQASTLIFLFRHSNQHVALAIKQLISQPKFTDQSAATEAKLWNAIIKQLEQLSPSVMYILPGGHFNSRLLNSFIHLLEKRTEELSGKFKLIRLFHEGEKAPAQNLNCILSQMKDNSRIIEAASKSRPGSTIELAGLSKAH